MNQLIQAAKKLEAALREFSLQIAKGAGDSYEFRAQIEKSSYHSPPIISFFARAGYASATTGNQAEAVWNEFCRRQNWNEAHAPMVQLEGPSSPKAVNSDEEIPF